MSEQKIFLKHVKNIENVWWEKTKNLIFFIANLEFVWLKNTRNLRILHICFCTLWNNTFKLPHIFRRVFSRLLFSKRKSHFNPNWFDLFCYQKNSSNLFELSENVVRAEQFFITIHLRHTSHLNINKLSLLYLISAASGI